MQTSNTVKNKISELTSSFWYQLVILVIFIALAISALALSIFSLTQTENAFRAWNDNTTWFEFKIGLYVSWLAAIAVQYIPTAALFMKQFFAKNEVIYETKISSQKIKITDSFVFDFVFVVFSIIDGATNVLWFYGTNSNLEQSDQFKYYLGSFVGYGFSVFAVFFEEFFAMILVGLVKSIETTGKAFDRETSKRKNPSGYSGVIPRTRDNTPVPSRSAQLSSLLKMKPQEVEALRRGQKISSELYADYQRELRNGSSSRTATYVNPVITSNKENYSIYELLKMPEVEVDRLRNTGKITREVYLEYKQRKNGKSFRPVAPDYRVTQREERSSITLEDLLEIDDESAQILLNAGAIDKAMFERRKKAIEKNEDEDWDNI